MQHPAKLYIDGQHVGDVYDYEIDGVRGTFAYALQPITDPAEAERFIRAARDYELRRLLDENFGLT